MMNSAILKDRNVIITGASRGLGINIVKTMWMAGANLMLIARDNEALAKVISSLPHRPEQTAYAFSIDISAPNSASLILGEAQKYFDRLDVLVNNAAIQGPIGPSWQNDWSSWNQSLKVNLLAPIELSRICAAWMIRLGKGKIICLSGGGATSSRPNFSAYAVAKTGLVRFSEILADELRKYNIQVNCIAPGSMSTAILDEILEAGPENAGQKEYDFALKVRTQGGVLPESVAQLAVFLASSASDRITGKLISAVWDPWRNFSEYVEDITTTEIYTLRRIVPKDRGMDWGEV
jgi:NAD(P)-dependent dehydrogenase (short-subunit alcohol dehydrogenase family)